VHAGLGGCVDEARPTVNSSDCVVVRGQPETGVVEEELLRIDDVVRERVEGADRNRRGWGVECGM
jgi:hypothetical protein